MKFLTTKQIAGEIERVIREARKEIIIISPYVSMSQNYEERLKEAEKNNVKIKFVFGKEEMKELEEQKFFSFDNMKMFFLENLHAKCYINEDDAIITSMNLYEYSENNREMGILIEKKESEKIYSQILREAESIITCSEPYYYKQNNKFNSSNKKKNVFSRRYGYCIRCGDQIEYDSERPFCYDCYLTWASFSNVEYPENYCHECGQDKETSMEKPLCYKCYKVSNE